MSSNKAPVDPSVEARTTDIERSFMRLIEERNEERVKKLLKSRTFNRKVGLSLGAGVLAIYAYTIYAIKQETFLDNFDAPEVLNKE